MIVHYKEGREDKIHSLGIVDFIRITLVDDSDRYRDHSALADFNERVNSQFQLTAKLIELFYKKGQLTIEEIQELLPNDNYMKIVAINDEWQYKQT